jgi:hypothetical protein
VHAARTVAAAATQTALTTAMRRSTRDMMPAVPEAGRRTACVIRRFT